ncbi:MAG: hypothetical protein EBX40_04725 [Gammaproteobacteria bacterium]|nr:hypothetical protein [Gammaproteobacteria bacterium]
MGFSSISDLRQKIVDGQTNRAIFYKVPNATLGSGAQWYDVSLWTGSPVANAVPGTLGTWTGCNDATGNGTDRFNIPHGGNVSPATKHLISLSWNTNSVQCVPAKFMLLDIQGYYKVSLYTTSLQTLTGTPILRYTNGVGCRLFLAQYLAGSGATTTFTYTYTNQAGVTVSPPTSVTYASGTTAGIIGHTGNANLRYVPFLPLANGDTGVRAVNTFQITGATVSGAEAALYIAKPIAEISFTQSGTMYTRDFVTQGYSLPRIVDDACLSFIYQNFSAPNTGHTFHGELEVAWG